MADLDGEQPRPPWRVPLLSVLLLLNAVVLLGQVWPEGAPPFARWVNIAFLTGSMGAFIAVLRRRL